MTRPTYQQCLDAGMTAREAARARGVNRISAYSWAGRNNRRFKEVIKDRDREYRRCLAKGLTLTEAAQELGVCPTTVSGWAARQGVKFATMSSRYQACVDAGMTVQETADKWGRSTSAVRFWARQNGQRFKSSGVPTLLPGKAAGERPLTEAEEADYRLMRRKKFSRAEALRAIGREDLIP